MFKTVFAGLLVSSLIAPPATAGPAEGDTGAPDEADLRFYLFCSEVASQRPLSFDEAFVCGNAFDRVKLAFVPGVSADDFKALSTRERAEVNLTAYQRFREWFDDNPNRIEALREEMRADLNLIGG